MAEALRAHASVICLQHPSLPPLSATEQVSLFKQTKKKFKSSIIPAISTFITDYFAKKKKKTLFFFKANFIYIFLNNFFDFFFFFLLFFNIVFLKFQTVL